MAASTITRATWVNDSGTPAVPVGDGTAINNARLQADVYDKIDQMFAGAGAYATLTVGGKLAVEGSGNPAVNFSGGVAGRQALLLRNTTAGAASDTEIQIGNDATTTALRLWHGASNYTPSGIFAADGAVVEGRRPGGLTLAGSDTSGSVIIYAGGTAERARFQKDGGLLMRALSTTPGNTTSTGDGLFYVKAGTGGSPVKIVLGAFSSGIMWYYVVSAGQGGGTWTETTVVP
jgi:hypothetical protein